MGAGLDQNGGTEFQPKGSLILIGILTRTSNQTGSCVEQNGDANSHPRGDPLKQNGAHVQREVLWNRMGLDSKGAPLGDEGL